MVITIPANYCTNQGLQLKTDKIFKVVDENGARVETEIFFSIPFDLILEPFIEKLDALYKWKLGMRGVGPFPPVAMFKAILYAKLNKNMSDRELERQLLRHPHVAVALGFDKVPSHQTFSYFKRERLTIEFLDEIFNALRDHLVKSGWIDFSSVTIDSAPVQAFVNLAKANREIKLNDSLARALFEDPHYHSLASDVIACMDYKKSSLAQVQKRICCLTLMVLYELGGFLSHAKVAKYLGKDAHFGLLRAVSAVGGLPSEVMMSSFKKYLHSVMNSAEFEAFRSYINKFLAEISNPLDTSVNLLFPGLFAVLQESCSIIDPDARLGYCAAKKEVFLGYRVQLLIDDKKKSQ